MMKKNNKNSLKVAIIDHVGRNAGMDCYDIPLLNSLAKFSINTFLFSNFNLVHERIFIQKIFNNRMKKNFFKTFDYIIGYLKAYFKCKSKRIEIIILHVFSAGIISCYYTLLAKILRFKVIVIAHDIKSLNNDDIGIIRKVIYHLFTNRIIVHNQYSYDEIATIINKKHLPKVSIVKHGNYLNLLKKKNLQVRSFKKVKFDSPLPIHTILWSDKKGKGIRHIIKSPATG